MLLVHAWAASTLLAAAESARVTVKSAPGVITAEDMTRVRGVEAWLDKGGPPPQSWEVKTKADVSIGKELARGRSKCVRHGRLGTRKVVVVAVCPVSNSSAFAGHNYKELHAAGEALKRRHHLVEEMYFLEVLRGRPGIPTLRGAFRHGDDLSLVVDDCGVRITGFDHKKQPRASDAWRAFAKRDPLGAARALLEVFRSVVDYGGYLIKDFTPHQFTLHGNKLYLVDGPDVALDGPMALFLRGRPGFALCGNQPVDGARRRVAACSNALPSFPMQKACRATCPTMRTRFSRGPACCCPYPGTCGSPAARDLCHLDQARCHLIQNRPHATDAATAWWALPLILAEARGAAQTAVAVARGRLLDHKGRRATFGFVLNELEESQRRLLRRRLESKRQREVERMDKTINGTALEAPCWGIDVRGRKSCLSYDEALAADAAFPPSEVGSVGFVVACCVEINQCIGAVRNRHRHAIEQASR